MQDIYKDHKTNEMISSVYAGIEGEIPNYQPRSETISDTITIAELKPDVKPEVSKVVDENGEPLVVYYGSNEKFDVFDRTKGRANMDVQGMFFSPWRLDASGYGKNIYPDKDYFCFLISFIVNC